MIQACIFDVDGTVLDSMPVWNHLASFYLKKMGKEPSEDIDQVVFHMTTEESAHYLHEEYLPDLSEQDIKEGFLKLIDEQYRKFIPSKPGVVSFLKYLQAEKIPVVAATTGDRGQDEAAFQRIGIRDCFADILTTDALHTDKRHPYIYEKAAELMHSLPANTAVFEDTLVPVMTARSAGFQVVGIKDAASKADWESLQHYSDFTIQDFRQVDALLAWMNR